MRQHFRLLSIDNPKANVMNEKIFLGRTIATLAIIAGTVIYGRTEKDSTFHSL